MKEMFIMVLHQALGIEDQEPSFLCPNQIQENGITREQHTKEPKWWRL